MDTKNIIAAISLSLAIIVIWSLFFQPSPEDLKKKKQENESKIITKKANLEILISSIFFPTQISNKLLSSVADAYIVPNCPWVIDNSCLLYTSPSPRDATLSRMPSSA